MATPAPTTYPLTLQDRDLIDPIGLIRQLCDERFSFSRHLCQTLDPALFARLRGTLPRGAVESDLRRSLLDALNALLPGGVLFDEAALQEIALTDDTQSLLRDQPTGGLCEALNRRLLAEAYPRSIAVDLEPRKQNWHQYQVAKYGKLHDQYAHYADRLRGILEEACATFAPLAIVQSRAKTVSSYAEKVWRKPKYLNPLVQITDLCGARVITETPEEVAAICDFIRRSFVIDEANSLDARTRLRTEEFGYQSIHYVVELGNGLLAREGRAKLLQGLKAEIQVRTLLQHAWASISHDRIYKSQFNVPEHWKRELARVAALLEHADSSFAAVVNGLDTYKGYYGAYMTDSQMAQEVDTLQTILENEPVAEKKPAIALQIARLARARWDWQRVVTLLTEYQSATVGEQVRLLIELGDALCHLHRADVSSAGYRQGVAKLEEARRIAEDEKTKPLVDDKGRHAIYAVLAAAYSNVPGEEWQARKYYKQAYEGDPSSPYYLASYLEYEIRCSGSREFIGHMRHTLHLAVQQCRAHIEAGIELPWAFFTMGKLYILLGQPYEALAAYAKGIARCLDQQKCYPEQILADEQKFIANINYARELSEEDRWVEDVLLLFLAVKYQNPVAKAKLSDRRVRKETFRGPVVIVAGGTDQTIAAVMSGYRECLVTAFGQPADAGVIASEPFTGTVISGGTTAGIPGIIGEIGENARRAGAATMHLLAYLPRALPYGAVLSPGYDEHLPTRGDDFSACQPLQNWIDLVAAGVNPAGVKVLGINGGKLALLEYHLALALGATVGILTASGRAAADLRNDADWQGLPNLIWIPFDRMAVHAFINQGKKPLSDEQGEKAGKAVHERYLRDNRHKLMPQSVKEWKDLDAGLQLSNIEQAQCSIVVLRSLGFIVSEVQPGQSPVAPPQFTNAEVELMAEMEHGRWIIERLASGWQYGPEKDNVKKISPYLLSWHELPDEIKGYDRTAVLEWPGVLAEAGFTVTR